VQGYQRIDYPGWQYMAPIIDDVYAHPQFNSIHSVRTAAVATVPVPLSFRDSVP
jgi:hypothetical protein